MKREELISNLKGGKLTKQQELDLVDEFMGKKKRTPLNLEIDEIVSLVGKHSEAREFATRLISKLKSGIEGRGVVPEAELSRLRKAFKAMVASLEED